MLSKSKNILMSLNSKQKSLCQMATTELYPKEHRSRSRQIFWGAMDFCPMFPKLARKNSKENDLQKTRLRFISWWANFFKSKHL